MINIPDYLSRGFHTLDDAEQHQDPGCDETQQQLPLYAADVLQSVRHIQNTVPTWEKPFQSQGWVRSGWICTGVDSALTH